MSLTNRALWTIERNLAADLALGDIAAACGVSRCHLAHAFGEATGLPVMDYVRGRRLTEAARALAGGASNILQVALDAGYASHEAFTRAVRARFGLTPETIRRRAVTDGLPLIEPIPLSNLALPDLPPPRFESPGPISIVGLAERASFGGMEAITIQWRRFMPLYAGIPDKAGDIPVGVSTELDDDGGFLYLCAAEVTTTVNAPQDLTALRIPARTYAVYPHKGHVSTIRQTYAAIWNHGLSASGRTSVDGAGVERHCETFDTRTGFGGLELWIPVAD